MTFADLPLADRRTAAWRDLPWPCGFCGRPNGRRCVTTSGATTVPHEARMADIAAYKAGAESRQGEVDNLTALVQSLREGMSVLQAQATELAEQLKTARIGAALVPGLQQQIVDLRADLEACRALNTKSATLLGAGGGNVDRTKQPIGIDRWYGGAGDVDKAITRAKANHAAGIRTWMSFKLPHSWADMAAGKGDAWVVDLYDELDTLGFEVWVAFHHEPEGDGDMAAWTRMQTRLAGLVPGRSEDHVKFWLIVTGWHQEYGTNPAYKWDQIFPTGAPIYGIAYDQPYLKWGWVWSKGVKTDVFESGWTEGSVYVERLAATAKRLGVHAGIGEYGYSDEAFAKDPAWLDRFLASVKAEGLLAAAYFDTPLNSAKSWYLGAADSAKRAHFYEALTSSRS